VAINVGSAYGEIKLNAAPTIEATRQAADATRQMQKQMEESSKRIQAALSLQAQKEKELSDQTQAAGQRIASAWAIQAQKAQTLSQQQDALASTALKAGAALDAIAIGGGAAILSTTQLAARVQTLGVVTTTLGKNVGYSETQIRNLEKAIQDQGITMQASRQAVAQMIEANIDLGKATDLARLAQDAAVISGENSSQSFEKLVYVIASSNTLMARRMGLLVNFEQAYQREAKAIGKSTADLTEHEKLVARTNEVMRVGTSIAGAYSNAMETAGKKVTSLDRHIEESKRMLGEFWLPVYADAIDMVTNSLKWWEDLGEKQKENASTAITYGTALAATEGIMLTTIGTVIKLKQALEKLALSTNLGGIGGLVTAFAPIAVAVAAVTVAGLQVAAFAKQVKDSGKDVTTAWNEMVAKQAAAGMTSTQLTDSFIQKQKEIQDILSKQPPIIREITGNSIDNKEVLDALNKALKESSTGYEEYYNNIKRAAEAAGYFIDQNGNLVKQIDNGMGAVSNTVIKADFAMSAAEMESARRTEELNEQLMRRKNAAEIAAQATKGITEEQRKFIESTKQMALQAGLSGELTKGWDDYHKNMADLNKEHDDLIAKLGKTQRAELGTVAAANFVKDALKNSKDTAYQPFIRANQDLIDKHAELEKSLVRARRLYGETSDEVEKYTKQLSENEQQLALAAKSQDLQAQLEKLKRQGYDPNSKAVQDLNEQIAENEQKQKDLEEQIRKTTMEFIYQKAAMNLGADASLELARKLGLISEEDYASAKAVLDLNTAFDEMNGILGDLDTQLADSKELTESYTGATNLLAQAIAELKSKHIQITVETIFKTVNPESTKKGYGLNSLPGETQPIKDDPQGGGIQKAAGGFAIKGQKVIMNEPGYQGELLVMPASGYVLNHEDAMQAVQNSVGGQGGGGGGDINITVPQVIYGNPDLVLLENSSKAGAKAGVLEGLRAQGKM
jgi:hypothetical protein